MGRPAQKLKISKLVRPTADGKGGRNSETLMVCLGNYEGTQWKNSCHLPGVMGKKLSVCVQCSLPENLLALWVKMCKKSILSGGGTLNCCSAAILGTPQGEMG